MVLDRRGGDALHLTHGHSVEDIASAFSLVVSLATN